MIDEGTSDHLPILIQSPLCVHLTSVFQKTNWNISTFLLNNFYEYWLSLVYNYAEQFFFTHFSEFLTNLWDRCSIYKSARQYRSPWPPNLVTLAREVNRRRRIYRRNKTEIKLYMFLQTKALFIDERS